MWVAKWTGYTGTILWEEAETEAQARNIMLARLKRHHPSVDIRSDGEFDVYSTEPLSDEGPADPGIAAWSEAACGTF